MSGCWRHDSRDVTIQRTIDELRANAESWESNVADDECRSCLAPAFRAAIPLLEKKGSEALPLMLTAKFGQGYSDPQGKATMLCYAFSWLELDDAVRGFYLRPEGEPDVDLFPALSKSRQEPPTAWLIAAGPIFRNEKEKEQSTLPAFYKGTEIVIDSRILARKKLLVGLILADGRKTAPVLAYFQTSFLGKPTEY
jgi:hypothetical protein